MQDGRASVPVHQLDVSIAWEDDGCVLAVGGELDIATEGVLDNALSAALEVADDLTVDLGRLTFADSAGVAMLARWSRSAAEAGQQITVRNCPPSVELIADVVLDARQWLDDAAPGEGRM